MLKLAQVLNSKLCHELSGLVGAITMGVELINSSDLKIKDKANQILSSVPNELYNLINFYRIAYGSSDDSETINFREIKNLCSNIIAKKIKFEFLSENVAEIDTNVGKLIMCLFVSASKNILRSGNIKVDIRKDGNHIIVNAHGDCLKDKTNKMVILNEQEENSDLDVYNAHEYYISHLSRTLGFKISTSQSEGQVQYTASCLEY
ncbi:MAG: histidine phosphotransferase family protein [Janthinobacterium lividum]